MPFKVVISGRDHLLLRFHGPINEQADFAPIKLAKRPALELNLGEVTLINSVGLRGFAAWSAQLENDIIELSYVPKFFVDQLNMIPALVPDRTKVISFYVPYFDAESESEKLVLYRRGLEFEIKGQDVALKHPAVTSEQGREMEIDILVDKYFNFLTNFG